MLGWVGCGGLWGVFGGDCAKSAPSSRADWLTRVGNMRTLRIRYLDDGGGVSERAFTGFVPFGDDGCSALPVPTDYMRPMLYDRIIDACDVETGELIDVRELCGAPQPPGPIQSPPLRRPRPKGKHRGHGSESFKGQRRWDSDQFFMRYGEGVIWNHFRNRLIAHFNSRCFACDAPGGLQLDHHVPLSRGGRREPGNIVVLCGRCNVLKWDYRPEDFYSTDELDRLAPLLAQEAELLSFEFDRERWRLDPTGYMSDIGISPLLIHEVMTNPHHEWCVERDDRGSITISFSIDAG